MSGFGKYSFLNSIRKEEFKTRFSLYTIKYNYQKVKAEFNKVLYTESKQRTRAFLIIYQQEWN
ncbi:hypothetical protein TTHERM_00812650 (macronuclear) [Tetrahymena thermophila SB210]|uniref:Uncharacterized protein n=1 Tax=Tetrahymena thermophila (strain SB210) TaxID=312017 RepID=Q22SW6_TETTS|nr:hypothetical protein TTHERM_00812650 [Tetrahymena thermophila SB210]EAR88348.1 hypothetical protein TTHERM_00812650 [Tetrahymena thermophila SB210]|eukprot:XP_001008593.1 hypothetical protein TTHERM_00812650 [Tetrahymena thermophila SB210]